MALQRGSGPWSVPPCAPVRHTYKPRTLKVQRPSTPRPLPTVTHTHNRGAQGGRVSPENDTPCRVPPCASAPGEIKRAPRRSRTPPGRPLRLGMLRLDGGRGRHPPLGERDSAERHHGGLGRMTCSLCQRQPVANRPASLSLNKPEFVPLRTTARAKVIEAWYAPCCP